MKSQPGPPMTLGNAAAACVQLIVWCKVCSHEVEPDPSRQPSRIGRDSMAVACGTRVSRAPGVKWSIRTLGIRTTASASVLTSMLPVGSPPRVHDYVNRWPARRQPRVSTVAVQRVCNSISAVAARLE